MIDIDTLIEKLRAAAAQHGSSLVAETVEVRPWPSTAGATVRDALIDALTLNATPRLAQFLAIDADDFIDLAFRTYLGRAADPAGRAHYRRALQQNVPRLETLAQLAASPEGLQFGGRPRWPLWLRPFILGLRLPFPGARRVARAVLRRLERRLGKRTRGAATAVLWRAAAAIDEHDRDRRREAEALSRDLAAATERLALTEGGLALTEGVLSATRAHADDLSSRVSALVADHDASSKALTAVRARLAVLDYAARAPADARPPAPVPASDDDIARYYVALESVFRGEPSGIRARLEADYLALLVAARADAGDGRCVDLGCGRGEWLDVLAAHGVVGRGVDANAMMAAAARERGHEVALGDALAYLRMLPDDGALAISAFHLVEHLPFPMLFQLIAECRRALKPRGLLILETPNPENVWVATHTFHHDPTHGQPLTPASLEFLVNHHGLETVAVLRLHPYPEEARLPGSDPVSERLNGMTCCGQDFAIVAKKTPLAG